MRKNSISAQDAWEQLFEEYNIQEEIKQSGFFKITADQIKKVKEPRLMTKWDSSKQLPFIFKKHKINVLPTSRGSYILGNFELYEKFPEMVESVTHVQKDNLMKFETIDINNITSESTAINILLISNILEDFLGCSIDNRHTATFNGRMGTSTFHFNVNRYKNTPLRIKVDKAQCEIDVGLENKEDVVIMEAKNIVYPDFHIRQLYFPYRLWKAKINKPIRLVYSVYSNQIYRLYEYKFEQLDNYSSIKLINKKFYSLEDTKIELEYLYSVFSKTTITKDDKQVKNGIPFIQADSFDRLISLLEILSENGKSKKEIADIMELNERQADYYFNAGKYLGLLTVKKGLRTATPLCKKISKLNYKERQLKFVELMLEHQVFNHFFNLIYSSDSFPKKKEIADYLIKNRICKEGVAQRRAQSVLAWLKWVFNLKDI